MLPLEADWPWADLPQAQATPRRPRVSVVTPSLNQGEPLEACIRSVALQRPSSLSLEHLVIDGGSTDRSVKVLRRYSPWLSYWSSENDRGQSHAINKGLQLANGEWIYWLNSDDLLGPRAFAGLDDLLSQDRLHWILGRRTWLCGDSLRVWEPYPEIRLEDLLYDHIRLSQPAILVRRSALNALGPLREDLHYAMDYELWIRIFLKFGPPHVVDRTVGIVRPHGEAKSSARWHCFALEMEPIAIEHAQQLEQCTPSLRRAWRRKTASSWSSRALEQAASGFASQALRSLVRALRTGPRALHNRSFWSALRLTLRSGSPEASGETKGHEPT